MPRFLWLHLVPIVRCQRNTDAPVIPDMPADRFPYEFVPKIQPSHHVDQKVYGHNDEHAKWVTCPFHRSTWFVNHPREAFLSPDQKLHVSTYEQDKHIVDRTPDDEIERYIELEGIADAATPGDRFTYDYEWMSRREVTKEIEDSVHRQLTIYEALKDQNINLTLIPAFLGWEDWHLERCRPLLEINTSVAFDTTQINSKYDKQKQLETLDEVIDPDRVFVNGTVAGSHLRLMPRSVVAFSGKVSILDEIRDANGVHHRDWLSESIEKRIPEINNWQAKLTQF